MKITKDMSITDIIQAHPEVVQVFMRFGMHCFGCAVAKFENLEQGALAHGIDVDLLVIALNEAVVGE